MAPPTSQALSTPSSSSSAAESRANPKRPMTPFEPMERKDLLTADGDLTEEVSSKRPHSDPQRRDSIKLLTGIVLDGLVTVHRCPWPGIPQIRKLLFFPTRRNYDGVRFFVFRSRIETVTDEL